MARSDKPDRPPDSREERGRQAAAAKTAAGGETGPLAGRRILVTRTREQNSGLAARLRALGADVIEVPTIRIVPPGSYAVLDAALARLPEYDTLLVTSANTAAVLAARRTTPWVAQPYTVAIGPATAQALRDAGLRVDLEPAPAIAESVVRELAPTAAGKRMLLVRAAVAREVLPEQLRAAGAVVDVAEAYRTVLAEESRGLLAACFAPGASAVDAVTFTSSSTVERWIDLFGEERSRVAFKTSSACSIGPITSATLREHGIEPATEARQHDVAGLVQAVVAHLHMEAADRGALVLPPDLGSC